MKSSPAIKNGSIENYFASNIENIKLLFLIFFANLLLFGQKIFFVSMPADDYMRYYGDTNTKMLYTNSARWVQALMNDYIFVGDLQILPYLHGVFGIFAITLLGFMSVKFFKLHQKGEIFLATLLISATPMFAHNLFFSTNITAWISLLFGLFGFIIAFNGKIVAKIIGTLLLMLSIGSYQTIIQIIAMILLVKTLIDLLEVKSFKELRDLLLRPLVLLALIGIAYSASNFINHQFLVHYHWAEEHRLALAHHQAGLAILFTRLRDVYTTFTPLDRFNTQFAYLYGAMALLAFLALCYANFKKNVGKKLIVTSLVLTLLLFGLIPLIINLPVLFGLEVPPRAHLTVGWMAGGFFIIQMVVFRGFFRNISIVVAMMVIVLSAYHITLFYDAGIRQTTSDIQRARAIVERIRSQKEYTKEPMKFHIFGGKAYNAHGWDMKHEQPFCTEMAKYKIFQYFTDFDFVKMHPHDIKKMENLLIEKKEMVHSYPGKNSIIVHEDMVMVFLEEPPVNFKIGKELYLKKFQESMPDVNATFNLYLQGNLLFYKKSPCKIEDTQTLFFLRLYKKNSHQPIRLDFDFHYNGVIKDGVCKAVVSLPPHFQYEQIYTGQFVSGVRIDWEANIYP